MIKSLKKFYAKFFFLLILIFFITCLIYFLLSCCLMKNNYLYFDKTIDREKAHNLILVQNKNKILKPLDFKFFVKIGAF